MLSTVALLLGVITVNVANPDARPLLVPAAILARTLIEIILVASLMTGIGLLISLRASSVRQAQQRFSMVFLVPALIPAVIGGLPASLREPIREMLASGRLTPARLLLGALVVLNAVILAIAMRRFQRSRLITA